MKWWVALRNWFAGQSINAPAADLLEEGGIVYAEGYFRSGLPSAAKQPLAEIYALDQLEDSPELWTLAEQEKLSRVPDIQHPYFSIWAEALRQGSFSGELPVSAAWLIVLYAGTGLPVRVVRYLPVIRYADVDQVIYQDVSDLYI